MFSSRSPSRPLLALLLLYISSSTASPSVAISTQAIVTTITAPTLSNSFSTGQTVFDSTSTYEDIQTITTVDSDGNAITTTTDNGPSETVVQITSDVVLTIPITGYVTFESTLGQSTIFGPDPTTTDDSAAAASTSAPPTAAATTSSEPSVVNVSPAPPDSTQTSTYVSLGATYSPVTSTGSSGAGSTITSIASPSSSASAGLLSYPSGTPHHNATKGLSVGARAAIGTAVVVVCLFLGVLLFWLNRLRRQRNAVRQQYPNGPASGDEAAIFGFFSPVVGRPYEKDSRDEKDIKMNQQPSPDVRALSTSELTPPAVEDQQRPYRRPIPQRNPHSPHSPISPISPVHDAMPPLPQPQDKRRSGAPVSPTELPDEFVPRKEGLTRFPSSHYSSRSSVNVAAHPEYHEKG